MNKQSAALVTRAVPCRFVPILLRLTNDPQTGLKCEILDHSADTQPDRQEPTQSAVSPTQETVRIKTRLFEKGDSIQELADRWGYSRALVTKVIHFERNNPDVRQRLARYMGVSVRSLFGDITQPRHRAA